MPVLEGEIEQGRQHLGGEFDRNPLDPVEGFANRQLVENSGRPRPDQTLHLRKISRADDRRDHFALMIVLGRIHRDKHRKRVFGVVVEDRDAAESDVRGKDGVVGVDGHDVVEFRHRPIGAELAVAAEMDGIFRAQPFEIGPMAVCPPKFGIADVDVFESDRRGAIMRSHGGFMRH
ncbi:hypothetical protein [Sphingopyxis soli]|uniref:hypothetical protein n=1 Tax=Sphingopyxis soli TaxID=592051 RepID=UPI0031BA9EEC